MTAGADPLLPAAGGEPSPVPDGGPQRPSRRRTLASAAFVAVVVAFAVVALRGQWDEIAEEMRRVTAGDLVAATALVLASLALWGWGWYTVLTGVGARVPAPEAVATLFVGQLGKYVPGSVWPAVAQAEMGRRHGLGRRTTVSAYLLALGISTAVGAVLGAAAVPGLLSGTARWAAAGVAAGGVALLWLLAHPRGLLRLADRLLVLVRRPPMELRLGSGASLRAALVYLAQWVVLDLHVVVLARAVGVTGALDLVFVGAAFSLAVVAGLVVVVAPAGAGVREAVLTAALARYVDLDAAVAVAVLSRLVITVADLAAAGVAGAGRAALRRRRAAG